MEERIPFPPGAVFIQPTERILLGVFYPHVLSDEEAAQVKAALLQTARNEHSIDIQE